MFKKISSSGFSVTIVLVAILVLGSIGIAGWQVWQNRQDDQRSTAPPAAQQEPEQQKPTEPAPKPPAEKYLVIKEWGVRFTLPEHLRGDITYFMNDRAQRDFGGPVLVDFLSKEFSAAGIKCDYVDSPLPKTILSINRELDSETGDNPESPAFKRFNGARFYFVVPSCAQVITREGHASYKNTIEDLKSALVNTLEAAP